MTEQITVPRATWDSMREALEEACGNRCNAEYNPCYAREALSAAKAVQPQAQEADPNAPWLTKAHMLCTDHGVPQGNIEWRLDVLRELCPTQPQAQDKPCKPSDNA